MEGPEDRCPYERPFADGFDDCPAYQPVRFVPLDLTHAPLRAVWTCGHLDTSRNPDGGFYGSCRLGDARARLEWVKEITAERVQRWQMYAREFGEELAEPLGQLFAAKARQVEMLTQPGPALEAARQDLQRKADEFQERDFALLDRRAAELERIGFPTEPMRTLTGLSLEAMIRRDSLEGGFEPPAEIMASFPEDTREFLAGLFRRPSAGESPA